MHKVHASTASFPGYGHLMAVEMLAEGIAEPLTGPISMDHVQLCPQNRGQIDEATCILLRKNYPNTQFRLHANVQVLPYKVMWDASNFNDDTAHYFRQLHRISRILDAPAYSLHAGYRKNCSMVTMIENVKRIQDIFGDIPVAVEGLYPNAAAPQLMQSLLEYDLAYYKGLNVALDLSHINLFKTRNEFIQFFIEKWLENPQTLEIHISDNNGRTDQHTQLTEPPFWWDTFVSAKFPTNTVVFSEGNHRER